MLINDLVVLGRACPEPLKDGRVTVCLAGWSESLGFVRLYPTRYDMPFKRWDIIQVEVERNNRDTREESWKIVGSREEWEKLASKAKVVGEIKTSEEKRNLIGNLKDESVTFINEEKRSLGIVHPSVIKTYFRENNQYSELYQQGLPGFTELDDIKVKRDFPFQPRITYTCPDSGDLERRHDQQVLEWGFYEWFRKHPNEKEKVWENAGFGKANTDIYFLVGNQAAHRNSFMVISVLRFPSGPVTKTLLPLKRRIS